MSGFVALPMTGSGRRCAGGRTRNYSARWAGPDKDFSVAMQKVETKLSEMENPDRRAHFICSLSLVWPDDFDITVEGRVDGKLVGRHVAIGGLAMIRFSFQMAMTSPLVRWNLT